MNDKLLKALRCENEERAPVWLMRQAGRYMPQYRSIREKYSFLEMIHNPEIAAKVTMLPVDMLGVDAAILFSDILTIPEALGVGLRFDDGIGPIIERPLSTAADVAALPNPNVEETLGFVGEAIKLLRPQLDIPLIGFCGAPFTIASYMIEGRSSKNLRKTKQWMLRDPESFHALLDKIANITIDYLKLQIKAGAQAIQIFDSWANFLSHEDFIEFSLAYMGKIMRGLGRVAEVGVVGDRPVPVILFCRGSSVFAPLLADLLPDGISLDWNADINDIRDVISPRIALQGNLDPDILYASPQVIKVKVKDLLRKMEGQPGYIFNLGHGIMPDVSMDSVKVLVDTVKEQS